MMGSEQNLPLDRRDLLKWITGAAVGANLLHDLGSVHAADVDWLAQVSQSPKFIPPKARIVLQPLLVDSAGKPIRSLASWKQHRSVLRRRWLEFLGPMPANRPPVKLETLREDRLAGCIRQLVRYDAEPGLPVEGYLLRPEKPLKKERCPAIVALHQTTRATIDEIAGVSGPESQHLGLKLCRRGFIVFCPRCYLWQNADNYKQAVDRFRRKHPQTLGMHKMLHDAIRGVDVLVSLDDVDKQRIGSVGHSLGAKETLYLAAFDDRIRAAVASEGGTGFKSTNWDAPWYLGPGINQPDFKLNHHQLLAIIAPRPFLIVAGEKGRGAADGVRSWPYLMAAQPVWKLYDQPVRLGMYNHQEGHTISPKSYRRIEEWLVTYLTR